jgi:integrase
VLFLRFHYNRYIEKLDDYEQKELIQKSVNRICARLAKERHSKAKVENGTKQTEPLDSVEIDIIKKIIRPSTDTFTNEINPFRRQLQVRNACAILLLIELGCRASELLLIRADQDLKLTTNPTVVIQFSQSSQYRNRKDGASHKTRFRELPISRGLAALILEYLEEHRPYLRKQYKGNFTEYLFISEKDGGALTTSGLEYMLTKIYETIPNLSNVIHPHRFRVTRGIELRSGIDTSYENSNSPLTQAGETQDLLTTWGGWSTTSDMPRRYTQAHLQRKISDYLREKED